MPRCSAGCLYRCGQTHQTDLAGHPNRRAAAGVRDGAGFRLGDRGLRAGVYLADVRPKLLEIQGKSR